MVKRIVVEPEYRVKLIIGHVTQTTARLWVQGTGPGEAQVSVFGGGELFQESVQLEAEDAWTGVADFAGLDPATHYSVTVRFPVGNNVVGEFETAPVDRPDEFAFLLLSCNKNLKGKPNARTLASLLEDRRGLADVRFVVHTGDQIYYDYEHTKLAPSLDKYVERYNVTWGLDPYMARVLRTRPNYMVLDDHEIANDFNQYGDLSDLYEKTGHKVEAYLRHGVKAYELFQHSHNPQAFPGHFYDKFSPMPGVSFFVMDLRLDRPPRVQNTASYPMISERQEEAFFEWLSATKGQLRFVVSSLPFVAEVSFLARGSVLSETKWNSQRFRAQRDRIIARIAEEGQRRLVFLVGDMHGSYHATMSLSVENGESFKIHELMSSPVRFWLKPFLGIGIRDQLKSDWRPAPNVRAVTEVGRVYSKRAAMRVHVDFADESIDYQIYHIKKTNGGAILNKRKQRFKYAD